MANNTTVFSAQVLNSVDNLRAYMAGAEAIDQINQLSQTPIPSAASKLSGRWDVVCLEIQSTFLDIYAIFLTATSWVLYGIGATDLYKRCHLASRHAMSSTLFLHHYHRYQERFLVQSLATHRLDTSDLYLHPSLPAGQGGPFEIRDLRGNPLGADFYHAKGICRGMANWFFFLYYQTQGQFTSSDEHIKAVTKQFEEGAPPQAALLHTLNEEASAQLLNLQPELNVHHCDPIRQTDRQIAEDLCRLPPGTYALYSSTHRVNWIYSGNGQGYFFNPAYGSVKVNQVEDLVPSVEELVKTHVANPQIPHLMVDRISLHPI